MSISGLDAALSGLRVAQQQLNVISNNVANVGTPGYTRKILPQSTVTIQGASIGAKGDPIIRKVNLNLERDLWTQISSSTFHDVQAQYLGRVQQFHGPPEKELSIAANVAKLRDRFAALADSPEDAFLQRAAIDQASTVSKKINDLAALFDEMRNDTQEEMSLLVNDVNNRLETIAKLNKEIRFNTNSGKTTASLEDIRDETVKGLSELLEISFFIRSDNIMVVQTNQGVELAAEKAETLFFDPLPVGPDNYYPTSASGLYVGGSPADNPNTIEVTQTELGGKIGALLELRDNVIPRQIAQLDEFAHKLALRFEAQGLRLFTDASGGIPADTAPVPNPPGPLTPVTYVGFSSEIRVNNSILSDNSLVQRGTVLNDLAVQSGSNEVIRRIVEFTFGDVEYQEAIGNVDLRSQGSGGVNLQEWLGLFSENQITSTKDLSTFSSLNALIASGGEIFDPNPPGPPFNDQFEITFDDPRLGVPAQTYNLSLSAIDTAFPIGGPIVDALDQLVAAINALVPPPDPAFAVQASRGPYGQLVIESRANIQINASIIGGMNQEGLDLLGLAEGTFVTKDPYIEVQVGKDNPVRITIEPNDDETDLQNKLEYDTATQTGVPGLFVDIDPLTGFLSLRPGRDDSNGGPLFGGDIRIVGGPFASDGTGGGGVGAGATVLESLFGNNNPVTNVDYGTTIPFRNQNLGPNADINTGIISATTLIDYSQKMVNKHTEESLLTEARRDDDASFRDLLQRQLLDESAVNIDEEMSNLIVVQTAYAAAARALTAIDELFAELLRAV